MGNTQNQPEPTHQPNVTKASTTMEQMISDDNSTPKPQFNYSAQQQRPTQYIQPQQRPQPQPQQYTQGYINPQQRTNNQYTNMYQYQTPQPIQPIQSTITPQPITSNTIQSNPSPHQLQIQLEQQMQQLRLLQQAQQLERQRLDLARQQRNLEAQQAASVQLERQHEIIRMQEQQRLQLQQQQQHQQAQQQQPPQPQPQPQITEQSQVQQVVEQKQSQSQSQQQVVECIIENREDNKYPVIFHWSHGGRDVYVAYSGDNWSQKYRMHRSHNDFSLIMEIQPGVYHYKFIVDNQWRCAPDQKHVRDANGAYSNVLDVRSHSYQQVIDEQKRKRKQEKQKAQYQYTQNLPKPDHFVQDPPICPIHLHKVILNNNDNKDKNKKINTMELPKPLRVSLNHLYVSDKREEEVVTLGITERYKEKFYTTVYYTPIDSRGTMESTFQVSNNYY